VCVLHLLACDLDHQQRLLGLLLPSLVLRYEHNRAIARGVLTLRLTSVVVVPMLLLPVAMLMLLPPLLPLLLPRATTADALRCHTTNAFC
jgi:hypothetical protein